MIKKIALLLGYTNVAFLGLIMTYTLIMQWYYLNNTVIIHFNTIGEAFIEHVMGIILLPCTVYYLYQSLSDMRRGQQEDEQ